MAVMLSLLTTSFSFILATNTHTPEPFPMPFPMLLPLPLPLSSKKLSVEELIRTHFAHVLLLELAWLICWYQASERFWLMEDAHTYSTWFTFLHSFTPSFLHSTIQRGTAEHNAVENERLFSTVHTAEQSTAQYCAAQYCTRLCRMDRDNILQAPHRTRPFVANLTSTFTRITNSSSEQSRTEQSLSTHSMMQQRSSHYSAAHYRIVQFSTVQFSASHYTTVQCSVVHLSWQHSAALQCLMEWNQEGAVFSVQC